MIFIFLLPTTTTTTTTPQRLFLDMFFSSEIAILIVVKWHVL